MYDVGYRQAAVDMYERIGSLRAAASLLRCSAASICRWTKQLHPIPRRVAPRKVIDAYKHFVAEIVRQQPMMTCLQVAGALRARYGIEVSRQLICRLLHSLGFRQVYARVRHGQPTVTQVVDFVTRHPHISFSATAAPDVSGAGNCGGAPQVPYVALDESGFDHRPRRLRAYVPRGSRVICRPPPTGERRRFNLLLALSADGTSHSHILGRPVCAVDIAAFLDAAPFPPGTRIVLDNASIHKAEPCRAAAARKKYTFEYLPPYSPQLNPVELAFAALKNRYYRLRMTPDFRLSAHAVTQLLPSAVAPDRIRAYFRHVDSEIRGLRNEHSTGASAGAGAGAGVDVRACPGAGGRGSC